MSRIIREARPTDMAEIMLVMDAAKKIMRQSGNMYQWGDGYPSEAVITADIERNGGFVIENAGKVVGYFAFLPFPEPTYSKIYEGEWIDDVNESLNRIQVINILHAFLKDGFLLAFRHIRQRHEGGEETDAYRCFPVQILLS